MVGVGNQSVSEPHGEGFIGEPINDLIWVKPPKVGFFLVLKINQLYCKILLVLGARVLQDACMTNEITNTTMAKLTKIETTTCGRCLGSGKYSYHQEHGNVCFNCNGKGEIYTKRGLVAISYFKKLRLKIVKILDTKIGDRVKTHGKIFTITQIDNNQDGIKLYAKNGYNITIPRIYDVLIFTSLTNEECLSKTLEFQATLNKSGKPIKTN
jgi:hypothetical protein